MKHISRLPAVLVLACAAWAQQPSAGDGAPAEVSRGEVHGIVVSAKSGEPLRGAQVILAGGGRGMGRGRRVNEGALTGIDGQFHFAGLPAGDFTLFASKTGYGTQNGFRSQVLVALGADEIRKGVTLRLRPSAVVSGRVLDAFGEPLPHAQVFAMARIFFGGTTRWRLVQSATTNDLGEYRIHGLGAGKYLLASVPSGGPSPRGVGYREFAAAYYPDAASSSQATPFRLSWGTELSGMDFRLAESADTMLQGIVTDGSTGEPCTDCYVGLEGEDSLSGPSVTPTKEGLFVLQGAAPGSYSVLARARGRGAGFAIEPVVIPESGVVGVRLVLGQGQTVSGEVVLEDPPDPPPQPELQQRREQPISIRLEGERMHMLGRPPQANVPAGGGPFEMEQTPPGTYVVRLHAPHGGYLRAISLGGRPFPEPEITVPADGPLAGLRLHVAFDGATIVGTVKSRAEDHEIEGTGRYVLLIPDAGSHAPRELIGVGSDGGFKREGIAPGRYTLYAVRRQEAFDFDDPEERRVLEPFAKRITLSKGEKATVELSFVPEPQ
jgi:hypothetical protein